MPSTINLQPDHLHVVQAILHAHVPGREVRVFGSRVLGTAKPASDLDLCIMGAVRVAPEILEEIRFAFSESFLPMKVDVIEWAGLKDGFRDIIEADGIVIQNAG